MQLAFEENGGLEAKVSNVSKWWLNVKIVVILCNYNCTLDYLHLWIWRSSCIFLTKPSLKLLTKINNKIKNLCFNSKGCWLIEKIEFSLLLMDLCNWFSMIFNSHGVLSASEALGLAKNWLISAKTWCV